MSANSKGIVDRAMLIKVTQDLGPAPTTDDYYAAARGRWRIAERRTLPGPSKPDVALVVRDGKVVAAFRIDGWDDPDVEGRRAFSGYTEAELDRRYLGMNVSRYYPPRARNPIRYVTDVPPSPTRLSKYEAPDGDAVRQAVSSLRAEPLARIMTGDLELFHSNFLAWLFDALPDVADEVFLRRTSGPSAERKVCRERQHMDLVMEWPGQQSLVIENKVKALPDVAQLTDYSRTLRKWPGATAERPVAEMVVLSMLPLDGVVETGVTDEFRHRLDWRPLGYDVLANRLDGALSRQRNCYEVETARRYSTVVRALRTVVSAAVSRGLDEQIRLPDGPWDELGSAMVSALGKIRLHTVADQIRRELDRRGVVGNVDSDYGRGGANITWWSGKGDESDWAVGLQIENGQARRCVRAPEEFSGRGREHKATRAQWLAGRPEFVDFAVIDAALGTVGTDTLPGITAENPHGFNHYDPDFVYRFKKVRSLTAQQVLDAIVAIDRSLAS